MEMDGVDLPWVDNYIAYFKNVIEITFKTTESESSDANRMHTVITRMH